LAIVIIMCSPSEFKAI